MFTLKERVGNVEKLLFFFIYFMMVSVVIIMFGILVQSSEGNLKIFFSVVLISLSFLFGLVSVGFIYYLFRIIPVVGKEWGDYFWDKLVPEKIKPSYEKIKSRKRPIILISYILIVVILVWKYFEPSLEHYSILMIFIGGLWKLNRLLKK